MQNAILWVEENQSLRESALSGVELGGKALPDAIASDPALLVDICKAFVIEAVRQDAPEGVVEELIVPVRRMAATARDLDQYRYTTRVLSQMQGMRDRSELEPILEKALVDAPDDANKYKLEKMLNVLRGAPRVEDLRAAAILASDDITLEAGFGPDCVPCCFLGCIICLEFCPICCVVGCFVC